jgi:NADPH:quinone reductase-like Zn-dependent oxidoreductase
VKAIVFDEIGLPLDVLKLREVPVPEIGPDEVLVRMVSASINPGDFLFIQNLYPEPKKPHFPGQIGGNHGAGIVEKVGGDASVEPGTLVAFSYYNSWAEYAAVPAQWLIPLPSLYPVEKAGQLMNPITAWDLLAQSRVRAGQWLALTAGYSSIATMALQFARLKGVNVISIVRREHDDLDLERIGASAVLDLSRTAQGVREQIMEITQGSGIHGVIDNVGGPALGELVRSMAFGGQAIINGGMSAETFELHNFDVLLNGVEIRSSVYRYFFTPPQPGDEVSLREIAEIFGRADFHVPSGGSHPLADFREAIAESWSHPERGKRSFRM